ncbi:MAG TPA: hypothetical protein VGJ97_05530 [Anaerolineaceae bacterium]|jgi:hypothetical protein
MKKRWFAWVGAAVLLVMTIYGITGVSAWFSTSASVKENIIQTGSLDLQVTGGPLKASNLVPGADYAPMGSFCSKNTGSIDLKYRGLFEATKDSSKDLIHYSVLKIEIKNGGHWSTLKELNGLTSSLNDYFKFPDQDPGKTNQYVISGTLNPLDEQCYRLSVKLDGSTPDSLQGKTLDFVLHIDATQVDNPGWE